MARELYTSFSKVLLGKSAKSLLWVSISPPAPRLHLGSIGQHYAMALMDRVRDAGRVIGSLSDRNTELRRQIEVIRASAAPEAVAAFEQRPSDPEAEATHLRSRLKAVEEQNNGLQEHLKAARAEVRLAKDEACAEARAASETLADEIHQRLKKDRKLIKDYKKSKGFELGLTRTGQVTYEYGYWIALARFRAHYPDLEVAEDPASFPEDLGVDMPEEVPFDDSADVPEK
ncbi:hypothetical protein C4D60_Mb03t00060 [Musa balbisiana]|uniref:Uncharacterized protein n=1 Tax=Musa balbisiana TaxID=52838 RepID=A0A4S8J8W1_MUSBA|nr:hypothetical protein C4D60_Mb03t00060 [Musa balbisiana]